MMNIRSTVPVFEPNVNNYIVGVGERIDVNTVVIDGQIVMKDGQFVNVDEEEVRARSGEVAVKLWKLNDWPTP